MTISEEEEEEEEEGVFLLLPVEDEGLSPVQEEEEEEEEGLSLMLVVEEERVSLALAVEGVEFAVEGVELAEEESCGWDDSFTSEIFRVISSLIPSTLEVKLR